MPTYTKMRGLKSCDSKSMLEIIEENLLEFFNWAFLEADGFDTVTLLSDDSKLQPVQVAGQPNGRIWQANYRNWVWETGLESTNHPLSISGITVNSVFKPLSSDYFLNYREGRVVFAQPIDVASNVQVAYSHRWVNFYTQDVPWFRDIIFDAYRYEVGNSTPQAGIINLLKDNAVQLPAVILETVGSRRFVPIQLGDGSQWIYPDFLLHIMTDNAPDRSFLIDAFMNQKDKRFYLYDANTRAEENEYALDWHESPIVGAKTYPDLVSLPSDGGYRWKLCNFDNITLQDSSAKLPLYRAILRITLEVDFTS